MGGVLADRYDLLFQAPWASSRRPFSNRSSSRSITRRLSWESLSRSAESLSAECSDASIATYRPQYDELFSHIATLRAGQPTILRTINRYDDFNGWPGHTFTDEEASKIRMMIDDWDTMLCDSAEANGFVCADIHAAFNGADGLQPSGDLLGGDYTHPSQAGNDLIATVLEDSGYAPLA